MGSGRKGKNERQRELKEVLRWAQMAVFCKICVVGED